MTRLPPSVTPNEGAFIQPIALAVHGCQRAGIKPGHRVLICGAGKLLDHLIQIPSALGIKTNSLSTE